MKSIVSILLLCFLAPLCGYAKADTPLQIVLPPFEREFQPYGVYFYKVLSLALQKTVEVDGPFEIKVTSKFFSIERLVADLKRGDGINVMWTTINHQRETELLPIRVSLLKELNNYRLLLVRTEDQAKFEKVMDLAGLKKFSAGLGAQWPEVSIFKKNGLSVVTSTTYPTLFKMLAAERFDYFPRGLYEVWDEANLNKDLGIVIDNNIMLYYPAPFYFFVARKDVELANRIERGLKLAIADGSFDELLNSVPSFRRGLEEQETSKRKIIFLTD